MIAKKQQTRQQAEYSNSSENAEAPIPQSAYTDFCEVFFNRVQNGENSQVFLSLSYQGDCSVIQSLLQGAGIPSFTEFEHFNLVKGGGLWGGGFGTNIRLSILINDYDTAIEIIKQYIHTKIETLQQQDSKTAEAGKTAFALLAGSPVNMSQRILGITVYPKNGSPCSSGN